MSKLQHNNAMAGSGLQQQGNKSLQNGRPQTFQLSSAKNIPTYLDEFKHGFPSDGLSSVSSKWWGNNSAEDAGKTVDGIVTEEAKEECNELEEIPASTVEGTNKEIGKGDDECRYQGTGLLSSVRKSAAEEGREVVKRRVARGYGEPKLSGKEKALLSRVFESSLPSQWG